MNQSRPVGYPGFYPDPWKKRLGYLRGSTGLNFLQINISQPQPLQWLKDNILSSHSTIHQIFSAHKTDDGLCWDQKPPQRQFYDLILVGRKNSGCRIKIACYAWDALRTGGFLILETQPSDGKEVEWNRFLRTIAGESYTVKSGHYLWINKRSPFDRKSWHSVHLATAHSTTRGRIYYGSLLKAYRKSHSPIFRPLHLLV